MRRNLPPRFKVPSVRWLVVAATLLIAVGPFTYMRAYGAQLGNRQLLISSSVASDQATYVWSFNIASAGTLGSIRLQVCANDPIIGTPCTAPAGFDASSAVLTNQTGPGGFVVSPLSTANIIILSRPPAAATPGPASFTFNPVKNPSSGGSYYGRIETFASSDASGSNIDYGGIAFAVVNSAINLQATVPPYLTFCSGITISGYDCRTAAGNYINFGNLSPNNTASATTQLLTVTNADYGYNISYSGHTMTSGNNIISPLTASDVSRPGVSQFGFNLRANQTPSVGNDPAGPGAGTPTPAYNRPDWFTFNSGDTIASATAPDDNRKYTVSYIVNVPKTQPPGVYVSTVTYICLANF